MKIAVCMKQTPDTEATIKIAGDGKGIDEQNIKWIMNPYDEYATEVALRLKEKFGGETWVVTMGGDRVVESMRTALAMGIDKGVHLNDPAFAGSDATGEAKAIAAALKSLGPDIILCGKQAIDWDMSQVPAMVAEFMDLPQCTLCSFLEIAADGKSAVVKRKIEGAEETYEISLPAVISIDKGSSVHGSDPIQEARYASLPGIMKAKKKEIKKMGMADAGLSAADVGASGAKVKVAAYEPLPERAAGKVFKEQETADMVKQVVKLLREEAKVI
ncbi:MAG TPA: electron transfer flavoprotein subunit beta/FixA family protein [bacterium]|nr:electron transfer flavoprotein subunit beta/FixA family protein [bacterium]